MSICFTNLLLLWHFKPDASIIPGLMWVKNLVLYLRIFRHGVTISAWWFSLPRIGSLSPLQPLCLSNVITVCCWRFSLVLVPHSCTSLPEYVETVHVYFTACVRETALIHGDPFWKWPPLPILIQMWKAGWLTLSLPPLNSIFCLVPGGYKVQIKQCF